MTLTPFQPPAPFSKTSIRMEVNFNSVCVADNLLSPVIAPISIIQESKSCAIFISDCDMVKFWFTVKVTETDPDGVALRNLDSLDKVEVVGVIFGVVGRGEDTTFGLLPFQPRRRTLTIIENFYNFNLDLLHSRRHPLRVTLSSVWKRRWTVSVTLVRFSIRQVRPGVASV